MLEGFEKIHYLAYSCFFLGKIMFIASVGALYSGHDNPLPFAFAYAAFIFASFCLGMWDQWKKVGFGLYEHRINWTVMAPVKKHEYEVTLDPVLQRERIK